MDEDEHEDGDGEGRVLSKRKGESVMTSRSVTCTGAGIVPIGLSFSTYSYSS